MSGKRQKTQYSLALEPVARGETPVSDHQGAEPLVAKPAPESPALQAQPDRTAVVRDPYARWCGRGGTVRCPPIPMVPGMLNSSEVKVQPHRLAATVLKVMLRLRVRLTELMATNEPTTI